MKQKDLIKIAKQEIKAWHGIPHGVVMVILWSFIHRVTTGNTIEESFFPDPKPITDYEI